jgi:hypothetical protein
MKTAALGAIIFLSITATVSAQHGTAPNGYYPANFFGDTWTGKLTAVNDSSRELTLSYTDEKHTKTQALTGVLEDGYLTETRDGRRIELKPSMIPIGTDLTVFYYVVKRKEQGKKVMIDTIFLIKGIPNLKARQTYYKAF